MGRATFDFIWALVTDLQKKKTEGTAPKVIVFSNINLNQLTTVHYLCTVKGNVTGHLLK